MENILYFIFLFHLFPTSTPHTTQHTHTTRGTGEQRGREQKPPQRTSRGICPCAAGTGCTRTWPPALPSFLRPVAMDGGAAVTLIPAHCHVPSECRATARLPCRRALGLPLLRSGSPPLLPLRPVSDVPVAVPPPCDVVCPCVVPPRRSSCVVFLLPAVPPLVVRIVRQQPSGPWGGGSQAAHRRRHHGGGGHATGNKIGRQ